MCNAQTTLETNTSIAERREQCFLFSRIIGWLTPKIIYFYYLEKYFLDQSIQKIFYLILKKEALVVSTGSMCTGQTTQNQVV